MNASVLVQQFHQLGTTIPLITCQWYPTKPWLKHALVSLILTIRQFNQQSIRDPINMAELQIILQTQKHTGNIKLFTWSTCYRIRITCNALATSRKVFSNDLIFHINFVISSVLKGIRIPSGIILPGGPLHGCVDMIMASPGIPTDNRVGSSLQGRCCKSLQHLGLSVCPYHKLPYGHLEGIIIGRYLDSLPFLRDSHVPSMVEVLGRHANRHIVISLDKGKALLRRCQVAAKRFGKHDLSSRQLCSPVSDPSLHLFPSVNWLWAELRKATSPSNATGSSK